MMGLLEPDLNLPANQGVPTDLIFSKSEDKPSITCRNLNTIQLGPYNNRACVIAIDVWAHISLLVDVVVSGP